MPENHPVSNEAMRIVGKRVRTDDVIGVAHPFTGQTIGAVPVVRVEHATETFRIAGGLEPRLSRYERQSILLRTAELIERDRGDLTSGLTLKPGISLKDSDYDVDRTCDVFNLASQRCIIDDGEIISCDLTPQGKARRFMILQEPLRTISAITPFKYPQNMVAHKVAHSIATNNCLVCKQTKLTSLTALWFADLLFEAGRPPEMLSAVTGWPAEIGSEMVTNPHIDLITFTDSVPVGKRIAETAGYRRTVLELRGSDPPIFGNDLGDDPLATATDLAVASPTGYIGQRCTAVKRNLCQKRVADGFEPMLLERVRSFSTALTGRALSCRRSYLTGFLRQANLSYRKPSAPSSRSSALRTKTLRRSRFRIRPLSDCPRVSTPMTGPGCGAKLMDCGRHGQYLGGSRLPNRDVTLRRHQG